MIQLLALDNIAVWLHSMLRAFCVSIDNIVYGMVSSVYDLILTIARTSILSQAQITEFANRIYELLAIFMVFKVTLSLITYVVNPDSFTDKGQGIGPLTRNIILSLALLVLTPYAFNMAYQLQTYILEGSTIPKLIFGIEGSDRTPINSAGDTMTFVTMNAFVYPNTAIPALSDCITLYDPDEKDTVVNKACSGLKVENNELVEYDRNKGLMSLTGDEFDEALVYNYVAGVNNQSFGLMFRESLINAKTDVVLEKSDSDEGTTAFVMEYKYIISTIVGVVMLLILVSFALDIALRSIKLAFYQLIAPVPIISFVDPKSGKDGMFKKWYKSCFSTYLSLFIRLFAIYFAVYLIDMVGNLNFYDSVTGEILDSKLLKVFIIIGVLMFAKQLPKILEDFGLKMDGGFSLNPLKKVEEQALGGKRLTGALGAMTAAGADRMARMATAGSLKGAGRALLGAPTGLLGAAGRGAIANKGFSGGMSAQANVNRRLRESRIKGLSTTAAYLDYAGSKFGLDDATLERESTIIQKNKDNIAEAKRQASSRTAQYSRNVTAAKARQTTMKEAQSARKNVESKGKAMWDVAKDVALKKGNFAYTQDELEQLQHLENGKIRVTDSNGRFIKANGQYQYKNATQTEIMETRRKINEHQYSSNRRVNAANVEKLEELNKTDGVISEDFYVGDVLFKAGTRVNGDVVKTAKEAESLYVKKSDEAVFDQLAKDGELPDDQKKLSFATDEAKAFKNVSEEYVEAVKVANETSKAYNSEYGKNIDTNIDVTVQSKAVKAVMSNMVYDDSAKEINLSIAEVDKIIEENERNKRNIENSIMVEYFDENNNRSVVTMAESESRTEEREKENKRQLEKHQENRSHMQKIASGS